jgi:hypothetical protein
VRLTVDALRKIGRECGLPSADRKDDAVDKSSPA